MTKTTTKAITASDVIVFGLGPNNRPQAALFPAKVAALATKAAAQLNLTAIKVSGNVAALVHKLPAGRIHSNGRRFIPHIRRRLYDQLVAMATSADAPSTGDQAGAASGGASNAVPKNEAGKDGNPAGSDGLPKDWKDIAAGHLVLAQESLADGWWEAVVVERKDDMLSLRWRDYPRWKPFLCHVDAVALVNPSPAFKV
jgi:hypothetical protein